jgi:enediyne biosynthesis protein E4
MLGLYHNDGSGLFVDKATPGIVGQASLLSLTWAAFFLDFDLDGYPDIFAANGHLEPDINRVQSDVFFKQQPLLFRNSGQGSFQNVSQDVGSDFKRPLVARGAAFADFDHDGDPDILMSTSNGPAVLLRNDGGNKNNWLNVKLIGTKSNRSGLDSVVRVESASGQQSQTVHSGSSYCSASDVALIFGLKQDQVVTRLVVEWPSGKVQELSNIPANQFIRIDEAKGLIREQH